MTVHRILPIDIGLMRRLAFEATRVKKKTVTKKKEPRVYVGPKAMPKGSTATVPRETVMLARRLREWSGWNLADISEVTGLTPAYITQICRWAIRADIDPGRPPAPFTKPWTEWHETLTRLHEQTTQKDGAA